MEVGSCAAADLPVRQTILVTNDDGIDAPGLKNLVRLLVAADRYRVIVCAPDSDNSGVSHSLTWRRPVCAMKVEINGTSAFAVSGTPTDCSSLGISGELFSGIIPDLVISGVNVGNNCGYNVVYSGTVAGAREAFMNGFPSIAISYDWVEGKSNLQDLNLAAEVCLPVINAVLIELKNKTLPRASFLNVDVPTDVTNHKGFKIARQSKCMARLKWKQTNSKTPPIECYQTGNINGNYTLNTEMDAFSAPLQDQLLFKRVVLRGGFEEKEDEDTDYWSLKNGFISITPLSALSMSVMEDVAYFKDWLRQLTNYPTSSSSL